MDRCLLITILALVIIALGCETLPQRPALPAINIETLQAMDEPERIKALGEYVRKARASGALVQTARATQEIAPLQLPQDGSGYIRRVRYEDHNTLEAYDARILRVSGQAQGRTWFTSLRFVSIPDTDPLEIDVLIPWEIGCVDIHAEYMVFQGTWDVPELPLQAGEIRTYGDCVEDEPYAVPEPGMLALLSSGCALLWILKRRRGTHVR